MIATENQSGWWYENPNVHGQQLRAAIKTRQAQALTRAKLRARLAASKKTPSPVVACEAGLGASRRTEGTYQT